MEKRSLPLHSCSNREQCKLIHIKLRIIVNKVIAKLVNFRIIFLLNYMLMKCHGISSYWWKFQEVSVLTRSRVNVLIACLYQTQGEENDRLPMTFVVPSLVEVLINKIAL